METAVSLGFRSRLGGTFLSPAYRPHRVLAMLVAILILSMADLYMTLVHLTHFGMLEANPLARGMIAHGSPAVLAVWKAASAGLALGILFFTRRRVAAEIGAAVCTLVLAWLTFQWISYNNQVSLLTAEMHSLLVQEEPRWVTLAAPGT